MKLFFLFLSFFKIGSFAFGGGYTIVALAKSEFVEKRKWLTEQELLDFLALSQTLPGIISVNFAAFLGNKKGGFIGGIVSVLGMVLPAVITILLLAHLIAGADNHPIFQSALNGVRIAVAVMILNLTITQAKGALKSWWGLLLAVFAFIWIFFKLSPAIPIIIAGFVGWILFQRKREIFK